MRFPNGTMSHSEGSIEFAKLFNPVTWPSRSKWGPASRLFLIAQSCYAGACTFEALRFLLDKDGPPGDNQWLCIAMFNFLHLCWPYFLYVPRVCTIVLHLVEYEAGTARKTPTPDKEVQHPL
jgi:hypothetical protein